MDPNVFETANAGFAQAIYEEFLRDPTAVDPEWRRLFESGVVGERGGGEDGKGGGETGRRAEQAGRGDTATPGIKTSSMSSAGSGTTSPPPRLPSSPPAGVSPLKGPAAKLVANMAESLTVPTATTFRELPVAVLEARRRQLNAGLQSGGRPEKISFTHLIAFAIVQATKQQPVMSHTLAMVDGVPHRVQPEGIGLGLAVDVQRKDGSRGLPSRWILPPSTLHMRRWSRKLVPTN